MMNAFLLFNLKIALSLSTLAVFYKLFLSGNTLFRLNRYFLFTGMMISVTIGCVALDEHVTDKVTKSSTVVFQVSTQLQTYAVETGKSIPVDLWSIAFIIWLAGFVFQLLRCSIQLLALRKIRLHAAEKKIGGLTVYVTTKNIAPFSFGGLFFYLSHVLYLPTWTRYSPTKKYMRSNGTRPTYFLRNCAAVLCGTILWSFS